MRTTLKLAAILGVTVTLAACATPEPDPVIVPIEPAPMGKF